MDYVIFYELVMFLLNCFLITYKVTEDEVDAKYVKLVDLDAVDLLDINGDIKKISNIKKIDTSSLEQYHNKIKKFQWTRR